MITMIKKGNVVTMYKDGVFVQAERVEVCKCGKPATSARKVATGKTFDGGNIIQPTCTQCNHEFEKEIE